MSPNLPDPDDQRGAELSALLGDTMTRLDSREDVICADVFRVARPQRRRRVLATVAGTAAVVAALGGLGAYGLGALTPPGQLALPAGPGPSSPAASASPPDPTPTAAAPTPTAAVPTPAPTKPTAAVTDGRQLPARVAALYLSRLAPNGIIGEFKGQQSSDEVYVETQVDRGQGKVGLEINVQGQFMQPGSKDSAKFYRCSRETYKTCSVTKSEDGSVLLTATQTIAAGTGLQATTVQADLLRADGTRVIVLTGDVSDLKYGGHPRRGISSAQARKIATAAVWDLYAVPSDADVQAATKQIKPWTLLS